MKKLLFIFLLFTSLAEAQEGLLYRKETNLYGSACSVYPETKTLKTINAFIGAEINNGNWANEDDMGVTGVDAVTSALVSIKGNVLGTNVNSPTFTQYQGLSFNGTSSYTNTNVNQSTAAHYSQNSACFFVYTRVNNGVSGGEVDIGLNNSLQSYWQLEYTATAGGTGAFAITEGSFGNYSPTATIAPVLIEVVRTSSSAQALYKNGVSVTTDNHASVAVSNSTWCLGNGNSNFGKNQISFWGFGNSSINQANLNTDVKNILVTWLGW